MARAENLSDPWLEMSDNARASKLKRMRKKDPSKLTERQRAWMERASDRDITNDFYPGGSEDGSGAASSPRDSLPPGVSLGSTSPIGDGWARVDEPPEPGAEREQGNPRPPRPTPGPGQATGQTSPDLGSPPPPRDAGLGGQPAGVPPPAADQEQAKQQQQKADTWRELVARTVKRQLVATNQQLAAEGYHHIPIPTLEPVEWALADLLYERFPEGAASAADVRNATLGIAIGGTAVCVGLRAWSQSRAKKERKQQDARAEARRPPRGSDDETTAQPGPPDDANGQGTRPGAGEQRPGGLVVFGGVGKRERDLGTLKDGEIPDGLATA